MGVRERKGVGIKKQNLGRAMKKISPYLCFVIDLVKENAKKD
jgi:predicted component of type VI protein secretion system